MWGEVVPGAEQLAVCPPRTEFGVLAQASEDAEFVISYTHVCFCRNGQIHRTAYETLHTARSREQG